MVNSTNGNLAPPERLFFGGSASGLDTASIIDALTAVASRPITLAKQRITLLENRQKSLGQISGSLANLLGSLDALRKPETGRARMATLLDNAHAAYLGVASGPTAALGNFTVDILGVATSTKTQSTGAVGAAVSAALALDKAGLDSTPTAGTFTINGTSLTIPAATATNIVSNGAIGGAVNTSVPLNAAGLTLAPVSGTFNINGTAITFDAAVDSLSAVITKINTSAAGVTAAFDAGTQTITLTRKDTGPPLITLSNTSGNFLEAVNLVNNANVKTGIETAGTDLISLNAVIAMINGSVPGVTASLVNDADGRPNLLNLTAAGPISLGSAGDTSNFLAATHILESPAGATRTSVRNLGTVSTSATLASGRFATAVMPAQGSFKINGVSIAYDTAVDSLNSIISKINTSSAGVTATYDSYADKLKITNNTTGTVAIGLEDTVGNFLAATKVLAAGQTSGTNASYKINGGATQYSTTNTVTDALAGVTLSLKQVTTGPVTVNVAADHAQLAGRLDAFVKQFNSTLGMIATSTKFNEKGNSGALLGDNTLQGLQASLRQLVTSPAAGNTTTVNTLGSIGVSFGAVGAAAGAANTLTFDSAKFNTAMQNDPEGVIRLLTRLSAAGALDAASTGSLLSATGTPTNVKDSGKYTLLTSAGGTVQVTFTPDNGTAPIIQTITVAPNEVNTTLIPGMTLTFDPVLVDGTDTINITATEEGIGKALYEFVDRYTRTEGVMAGRDAEIKGRITDLNTQIDKMQARVDARRQFLIQRYATLETTIARLQGQQNALTSYVNKVSGNKG
jgi:flagellar hook-associated protein 2